MSASYESTAQNRVFDIVIGADLFASDWSNCDRISNYIGNLVSQRRTDSLRYANLFSSVLNELRTQTDILVGVMADLKSTGIKKSVLM